MQSAVFCYAPQDTALAHDIGAYLETNLPITPLYDECILGADLDLIDSVARGISADLAIAILSPDSVPTRWERARWEPAFLKQPAEFGSRLYFVLAHPCKFPDLLRRQAFFDCSESRLMGVRALKRRLFAERKWVDLPQPAPHSPIDLEPLRVQLADRPGSIADLPRNTALAFAHKFNDEFEGTFWIDSAYRTTAGILGDTAKALGLTLTGSVEQNRTALIRFCEDRRCLFLYENLTPAHHDLVSFAGRSSRILVAPGEIRSSLSLEQTIRIFTRWTHDPDTSFRHLADAHSHLQSSALPWNDVVRLGSAMVASLKHASRLAEANEILELLIAAASNANDSDALRGFLWDQSWILGHWGEPYDSAVPVVMPTAETAQLGFIFN